MEIEQSVAVLSALAQPTRLAIFRLLMTAGAAGVPAGEIARRLDAPQNTISSHLSTLAHAGLVVGMRQGRMIRYRVDLATTRELLEYLMKDCCAGNPQVCLPLTVDIKQPAGPDAAKPRRHRQPKDTGHD
jgi:ArsR family transcriptional regulator